MARLCASASTKAPKLSPQRQSMPSSKAASGISSIWRNMRLRRPRWSLRSGASESEQLPGTTLVTPCSSDGLASGSQHSCASKCVCGSTKPGATARPVASIVRLAAGSAGPTDTILPFAMPRSPRKAGSPEPSTIRPFWMARSSMSSSAFRVSGARISHALPRRSSRLATPARVERRGRGLLVEPHARTGAVRIAHPQHQLGTPVVSGGDLRVLDDRDARRLHRGIGGSR